MTASVTKRRSTDVPVRWRAALVVMLLAVAGGLLWYTTTEPTSLLPTEDQVYAEMMARFHPDERGRITLEIWERGGGTRVTFNAFDFNGNGVLELAEFKAMVGTVAPRPVL